MADHSRRIPGAERPGATRPTPEQAAEIEALTAAATAGPWAVDTAYGLFVEDAGGAPIADLNWAASTEAERERARADAEFIAAARTAVPALLAEMDALTAEQHRTRELLRQIRLIAASGRWTADPRDISGSLTRIVELIDQSGDHRGR